MVVSRLAAQIAMQVGLSEAEIEEIRLGGHRSRYRQDPGA